MNKELLLVLKDLLLAEENLKGFIDSKKEEYLKSIENESKLLKDIQTRIEEVKSQIEPEAIEEYRITGRKKLDGGIGIQERTYIDMDVDKVKEWCISKQLFLEVDMKAFEKSAPSLNLPFATPAKKTIVTFPKKLEV